MSAPLQLNAHQLKQLGQALEELSEITRQCGVDFTPYGGIDVGIGSSHVRVGWDAEAEAYVVDDRNGD